MKVKTQLKNIASFSKGEQIKGDDLLETGLYDYLNGGISPSGKWNSYNTPANTVTISEGGNSCGYVNFMDKPFWCGAHCYYLFNSTSNTQYLYYALKSQQDRLMRIRSGACMPNIKKSDLGMFEIVYETDESKQNKVVDVLSKCENIISARNQQLQQLDELVKARFVEMFGNRDCRISTFGQEFNFISRGKSPAYVECSDLAVVNQACIYWESLNYNKVKYNEVAYCGDKILQFGDVLINSTGTGTLGRANIFTNEDDSCRFMADSHVTIVRGTTTCNPVYIKCFLEQSETQEDIYRTCVSGSTNQIELSKEKFKQLKLPVPPIEIQEQFATFVKQIDKSKFYVANYINKFHLIKGELL